MMAFRKLPGIGPKSAERLTFYLLKSSDQRREELARSLFDLKKNIMLCDRCSNWSEKNLCAICSNLTRDQHQICIVEEPLDVIALESSGAYKGLYHVLHGALSPLDSIGPDELTIHHLLQRLETEPITEIIFGTNPTVTGEATAVYLSGQMKVRGIRMTHLAQGLPMGGSLEFADPDTLKRAILGRRE